MTDEIPEPDNEDPATQPQPQDQRVTVTGYVLGKLAPRLQEAGLIRDGALDPEAQPHLSARLQELLVGRDGNDPIELHSAASQAIDEYLSSKQAKPPINWHAETKESFEAEKDRRNAARLRGDKWTNEASRQESAAASEARRQVDWSSSKVTDDQVLDELRRIRERRIRQGLRGG